MASRRLARQYSLMMLYGIDTRGEQTVTWSIWPMLEAAEELEPAESALSRRAVLEGEKEFSASLSNGVCSNLQAIDQLISRTSTNWRIDRMPTIDRNILRLGIYEIVFREDIPIGASINEAIELAKLFCANGRQSHQFINGVLDRVAKDIHLQEEVLSQSMRTRVLSDVIKDQNQNNNQ